MAISPAHKFGQIIGDLLEDAVTPLLQDFAGDNYLYLDKQGFRPARSGKKVTWQDLNGNKHDLDFVLERGGTPTRIGDPVAFIESAWRRYTKHSRNKAQEIQGAILPLAATYKNNSPFIGTILAGEFTNGAITQLKSLGFSVLYFSYADVIEAFRIIGIDASFDEETPDADITEKIHQWEDITLDQTHKVITCLLDTKINDIDLFFKTLKIMVQRRIVKVRILPLFGNIFECESIQQAINFLNGFEIENTKSTFIRFEVEIFYNNGDKINNTFTNKELFIKFLNSYSST